MALSNPFRQVSGGPIEEAKGVLESEGVEETKRTRPSKSMKQGSYEVTKIGTSSTRPAQACTNSVLSIYSMGFSLIFYEIPECVKE